MAIDRTTVGKVSIFLNLVLALIFTGWAIGVWANHVDWQTPPGKSADREGRLEKLNKEIATLGAVQNRTLARWAGLHATLVSAEEQRQPRADWYREQLALIRTGQVGNQAAQFPVAELPPLGGEDPELLDILQANRTGGFQLRPQLAQQRRPVMYRAEGLPASAPPVPLLSLVAYDSALKQRADDIATTHQQIQRSIEQQQAASDQLNGVPGKSKGLRELLEEQRVAFNASQEEIYFLQQPTAVEQDDLRRLKRRLQQAQEREAELRGGRR